MPELGTTFLEYHAPNGDAWRIGLGEKLCAAFGIDGDETQRRDALLRWHAAMSGQGRPWEVVARLHQVTPLCGVEDADLLRPWSVAEIGARLGIMPKEVEECASAAVAFWKRWQMQHPLAEAPSQIDEAAPLAAALVDALLRREGFVEVDGDDERQYIARRILDLEDLFGNQNQRAMTRQLIQQEVDIFFVVDARIRAARQALNKKLAEQRADDKVNTDREEKRVSDLFKQKKEMLETMTSMMNELNLSEIQTGGIRRKAAFIDSFGGIIAAMHAFYADHDQTLLDGFATGAEIEILTTEYVQRPAQYRPDLALMLPSHIEHLFDPDYKPVALTRHAMRRLTAGFRLGLSEARAESGETVLDLDDGSLMDAEDTAADAPQASHAPAPDAPASPASPQAAFKTAPARPEHSEIVVF